MSECGGRKNSWGSLVEFSCLLKRGGSQKREVAFLSRLSEIRTRVVSELASLVLLNINATHNDVV